MLYISSRMVIKSLYEHVWAVCIWLCDVLFNAKWPCDDLLLGFSTGSAVHMSKNNKILKPTVGSVIPSKVWLHFLETILHKATSRFLTLFIPFTMSYWLPTWPPRLQCLQNCCRVTLTATKWVEGLGSIQDPQLDSSILSERNWFGLNGLFWLHSSVLHLDKWGSWQRNNTRWGKRKQIDEKNGWTVRAWSQD